MPELTQEQVDADKLLKIRDSRQEKLVPRDKLQEAAVVVIGNGAVGRNVALQVAAIGVKSIQLWDNDKIEQVNLSPQLYREDQLGKNKAEATGEDCIALNKAMAPNLTIKNRKFCRSDWKQLAGKFCFVCVDSIETRLYIYEMAIKSGARWIGDARVAGEIIRVISEDTPVKDSKYNKTLFTKEEAYVGECSSRMVSYGAVVASGLLVSKFAQTIRGALSGFTDHSLSLNGFDLFENVEEK